MSSDLLHPIPGYIYTEITITRSGNTGLSERTLSTDTYYKNQNKPIQWIRLTDGVLFNDHLKQTIYSDGSCTVTFTPFVPYVPSPSLMIL
jgi:hypothetical protein